MVDTPSDAISQSQAAVPLGTGAAPAPSWFASLAPEDQGRLQNLGWDKLPPDQAALAAFKSFKETQARLGAPADELVRIRKDQTDANYEADMAAVWARLGKPEKPEGYDFAPLGADEEFAAQMREVAFKANLPTTAALTVADAVLKRDATKAKVQADAAAEVARQEALKLEVNWGPPGPSRDVKEFLAKKGAESMGFGTEAIEAMAKTAGGADVMEGFRRIGAASTEARFIPGQGAQPGQGEMTYEQAMARREEFTKDALWFQRFSSGDAEAKREFNQVNQAIARGRMAQQAQR